jgi:hypothetical protein
MTKQMNRLRSPLLLLALSGSLCGWHATAGEASTNSLNRFTFSGQAAFGISARFGAVPASSFSSPTRQTPHGDPYNYDNGYVLTDGSGNVGGQTTYWGYDNSSQISGNSMLMSRSAAVSGNGPESSATDSNPSFGGELLFSRQLGVRGDVRYGLEAALSFLSISLKDSTPYGEQVSSVTDAYAFTPGTTPPGTPPIYQGPYSGPGFLIGSTPSSSTSSLLGTAAVSGQRKYDADLIGFRLGPYVEFSLFNVPQLKLSLGGGFAAGWLHASASWTETGVLPGGGSLSSSGEGKDSSFVMGGYLGGDVSYEFARNWSAVAGVHYQKLGTVEQTFAGRKVDVDLSKTVLISLGVGYSF